MHHNDAFEISIGETAVLRTKDRQSLHALLHKTIIDDFRLLLCLFLRKKMHFIVFTHANICTFIAMCVITMNE